MKVGLGRSWGDWSGQLGHLFSGVVVLRKSICRSDTEPRSACDNVSGTSLFGDSALSSAVSVSILVPHASSLAVLRDQFHRVAQKCMHRGEMCSNDLKAAKVSATYSQLRGVGPWEGGVGVGSTPVVNIAAIKFGDQFTSSQVLHVRPGARAIELARLRS